MRKKYIVLIIILSILLILSLGAFAGYLIWQKYDDGLKTYTNKEYGFEFKYPRGWKLVVSKRIENVDMMYLHDNNNNNYNFVSIQFEKFGKGYTFPYREYYWGSISCNNKPSPLDIYCSEFKNNNGLDLVEKISKTLIGLRYDISFANSDFYFDFYLGENIIDHIHHPDTLKTMNIIKNSLKLIE